MNDLGITEAQIDRFLNSLVPDSSGCLLWTGARNHMGHGRYRVGSSPNNKPVLTHRLAFFIKHGWAPVVVRHSCDNPPCCNPDHLLAGDYADNSNDMVVRGRAKPGISRGKRNGNAKLTAEQVGEIKRLFPTLSDQEIADRFGTSRQNVSLIRNKKAWVHVK